MFGFEGINLKKRVFIINTRFVFYLEIFLDSSMVERTAVNRDVVGSSPTRGALAPWSSG